MRSVLWALALAVAHGINPANSKQEVLSDGVVNDSKYYTVEHETSSTQYSGEVRRYPNEPSLLREFQVSHSINMIPYTPKLDHKMITTIC
jgi:hypothetical protein